MNLIAAQTKAIEENATTTAEFDLVSKAGRGHCRFIDADMGIFTMLTKNGRTLDSPITLLVGHLADDDGFSVENFTSPGQPPAPRSTPLARYLVYPYDKHQTTDLYFSDALPEWAKVTEEPEDGYELSVVVDLQEGKRWASGEWQPVSLVAEELG